MQKTSKIFTALSLGLTTAFAAAQPCSPADFTADGSLDFFDISAFLTAFSASDPAADLTDDGNLDFFDISQFLTFFAQGCPTEIVIRDSIGPDNTTTNGYIHFPMTAVGGESNWKNVVVAITSDQDITLSSLRCILAQASPTFHPLVYDYIIRVWNSEADMMSDPMCNLGNCNEYFFDTPTSGPLPFGSTFVSPYGVLTTYEAVFDIAHLEISLPIGTTKYIGLSSTSPSAPDGGFRMMETSEDGPLTDWTGGYNHNPIWRHTSQVSGALHGRIALTIKAIAD